MSRPEEGRGSTQARAPHRAPGPEGAQGTGWRRAPHGAPRLAAWLGAAALACAAAGFAAQPASAQYFGRNRVQYDHMDFHVLETPHFQVHYYPVAEVAIQDAARMAERWYERLARFFQHDFVESPKPLIFYADHADLQQTNTLHGFIREATGGVAESLKDRVIMPLAGSYAATDRVLGHELVHVFQYDMAKAHGREAVVGLVGVPLWLLEGMAEYLSVGREDPHTAMWLRDGLLRDRLPTIRQIMTRESPYFPYRFGQALWAYIGGTYGDPTVATLFRRTLRLDFETAVGQVLGRGTDALSSEWRRQVEAAYLPLMEGRQDPGDAGTPILSPATGSGTLNVGPALSPDGRTVAFLSERDALSVDLFLADARTGRVIRRLASAASDTHFDALAWTGTSGTFSPDGTLFAFVVFAGGSHQLAVAATADGRIVRRLDTPGIGSIASPAWSPDAGQIAFTGTVGGISDLFVYDLFADQVRQLTRDRHADDHPAWSPDGSILAFATDRGPETDFERLVYSERRLALLDVASGDVQVLELFGDVRHSNPQFAPDGRSLYFLSDRDGFSDIYRLELESGRTERVTRLKTGVSGITSHAPALSVASRTGELAFSVFTDFGFHIHVLEAAPEGAPVSVTAAASLDEYVGRRLPPVQPGRQSRVADYLGDPDLGLEPAESFLVESATRYRPSLTLDRWGQPFLNASADRWGTHIGSAASLYFSDMLSSHHLGVAVQAASSLGELGAEFFYGNLTRRWNWMVAGGYTPSRLVYHQYESDGGRIYLQALNLRVLESRLRGQVAFPFSTTRRVELGAGLSHIGFHLWEDRLFLDRSASFFTGERERLTHDVRCSDLSAAERELGTTPCKPDPMNLAHASVGWVGDDSFFGLTSPIRGGRFRVGLEATVGAESFITAVADWRRYYAPWQNLTVAARGLYMGRYGGIENVEAIQPWFLGNEPFIRGYALESFLPFECPPPPLDPIGLPLPPRPQEETCPTFARLVGHRLAVANLELRVPLLGSEQFGLIYFPWLPTELVVFGDAGLAWDWDNPPTLELSRSALERVPVFSTGVSARFNVAGLLILEAYHAYPFQRPLRGSHWGFLVSPGW